MSHSSVISKITTRVVEHPLRQERVIVSPLGVHDRARMLNITVAGRNGTCGYAEAAATTVWSGETPETAQLVIERELTPLIVNRSFDHPRELLEVMDSRVVANPCAKGALDTAVWDLWAREQGVSAVSLFADRDPPASVPTRASVGTYPVEQTLDVAAAFREAGVRTLKFKIGLEGVDDVARLRAVRERFGDEPRFTVDANGAYHTLDDAMRGIEPLLEFNLELVEQPTPRDRIKLLAEVRRRIDVPMMADESVFTPDQLDEALDLDAFDVLSVYPNKNGGVTHTLDMAKKAAEAGKRCAIGCNLETDFGQAAMVSIAAGLSVFPTEQIPSDFPAAVFYQRSSVREPLRWDDGRVGVPTGPGFGVEPLD